jgi:hypothetical protein
MQTEWWGGLWSAMVAGVVRPCLIQGDWNALRLGPLQSLCAECHSRKWADDRHGYRSDIGEGSDIGEDGCRPMQIIRSTRAEGAEASRSAPLPRTQAVAWRLHVCRLRAGCVPFQSSCKSLKTFACAGVPSVGQ